MAQSERPRNMAQEWHEYKRRVRNWTTGITAASAIILGGGAIIFNQSSQENTGATVSSTNSSRQIEPTKPQLDRQTPKPDHEPSQDIIYNGNFSEIYNLKTLNLSENHFNFPLGWVDEPVFSTHVGVIPKEGIYQANSLFIEAFRDKDGKEKFPTAKTAFSARIEPEANYELVVFSKIQSSQDKQNTNIMPRITMIFLDEDGSEISSQPVPYGNELTENDFDISSITIGPNSQILPKGFLVKISVSATMNSSMSSVGSRVLFHEISLRKISLERKPN